jgi:hypothetical protein
MSHIHGTEGTTTSVTIGAIGQSLLRGAHPSRRPRPTQAGHSNVTDVGDDLLDEFVAATAAACRRDFELLEGAGVPHDFLWLGPMRFGVSAIERHRGGLYTPVDGGGEAAYYILPAMLLVEDGEEVKKVVGDLIAVTLSRPGGWWLRRGTVPILNPSAITRAEIMREPLMAFSTPIEWLRGGGQGICILDWGCNLRLHLGGVRRITADTAALKAAIELRLVPQHRPALRVIQGGKP